MRPLIAFLIFLFSLPQAEAQINLIPNPYFEDTINCPVNLSGMYGDQIYALDNWFPAANSPDYFNSCASNQTSNPLNGFGYQVPLSGNGYIGFYTILQSPVNQNVREIVGVQLLQNLVVGTKYYFKSYISAGYGGIQIARYFSNNIGIHFSNIFFEAQQNPLIINNNPIGNYSAILMDTINWVPFQFSFIADSSYMYLYVGNFYNDINTDSILPYGFTSATGAYYYMDNMCLSTDSNFCETISSIKTIEAEPFSIYPNPSSNILFFKNLIKSQMISIYNLMGQELFSYYLRNEESSLNISNLPAGNYFIKMQDPTYKTIIFQKH